MSDDVKPYTREELEQFDSFRVSWTTRDIEHVPLHVEEFHRLLATCRAGLAAQAFVADAIEAHVTERWWQDADLQDKLTAHGFLAEVEATEPCGDGCGCADISDFPTFCSRVTPLGDSVRMCSGRVSNSEETNNG